jgi:hypothetical protein
MQRLKFSYYDNIRAIDSDGEKPRSLLPSALGIGPPLRRILGVSAVRIRPSAIQEERSDSSVIV